MKQLFKYLFALFLMMTVAACAHTSNTDDDNDCPCPTLLPLDLPKIQTLAITTASADLRSETDKLYYSCDDFQVTKSDMDTFFKLTKRINQQDYMHAIDWMGCQAFGDVHFVDGTTAQWGVMRSAAGFVRFPDGRETHLFCDQCTKPFVP